MKMASTELCLLDAEENKEYTLIVSAADAEKARKDMKFAARLLKSAKEVCETESLPICPPQATSQAASTSSNESRSIEHDIQEATEPSTSTSTHIWTKPETLFLLSTFEKYKDEYQDGKGTVKQFWKKIANCMEEKWPNITGMKCSTKFQALKRMYKSILDHNKKSGNNRKEWEYLKIMDELFADKPWVKPLAVAGSHVDGDDEDEEDVPQRKNTTRKKSHPYLRDFIEYNKEEQKKKRELRQQHHAEKMASLNRLENMVERLLQKDQI